jgi:SAM-dependent methyltransferase
MGGAGSDQDHDHLCEICGSATAAFSLGEGGTLQRCPACGHLHRSLDRAPADHRDAAYGGDPALDVIRLRLTYRALRIVEPPSSVFEIGFGGGGLLRRFHDSGAAIGGVDPDQLQIGLDPEVRAAGQLWQGTMEDVPDGAFRADLVIGIHVIEHVVDPLETLRKAATMLEPGGRIVLLTPAGDSWGPSRFGSAWWMLEDPTHVRFFTQRSLALAAEAAGFRRPRVDRLITDSLSVDVASAARAKHPFGAQGALGSRVVLAAAAASVPAVLAMRALAPTTRPTLRLIAERGAA